METQDIDWSAYGDIKDAARAGDFGQVVYRARKVTGVSQTQLAKGCGVSQAAISRLENRGTGDYNMTILATAATELGIPFELVGLANQPSNGTPPVERREFMGLAAGAAVLPLAYSPAAGPVSSPEGENSQAAALRVVTASYRRLDASTASRDLSKVSQGHLELIRTVIRNAPDDTYRTRLAPVASEAASFAAWLAWDMGNHGSARGWYGSAVKAAQSAHDPLLLAYQVGSLASFEADTGNPHAAVRLIHKARHHLGSRVPPLAAAWLASIEATAHAVSQDRRACDKALKACAQHAAQIPDAEPVAWPWIFAFDERKLVACYLTCTARLGQPLHARLSEQNVESALSSGHDKQRALLTLDVALGYLATNELDKAFGLASRALTEGVRLQSGKIVERARAFRRSYNVAVSPAMVRQFDSQLQAIYM
ncbi:helix-turn-helix domain-containing protein [Streptomyces sp. NPDC048291]|uniref:helix-turn-helix domain-containing protein n=1 Tax=Streptomyces sp. NPDC048291 TaxID=3365530 RepID=UPI0037189DF4